MENKINLLLQGATKNGLFFSRWLSEQGYSRQLINKYRTSGWLTSLCTGVLYRTGEELSAFGALQSYNEQLHKEMRIAAHSALEIYGFNHYVPMGKPRLMVTDKEKLPQWLKFDLFDKEFETFSTTAFSSPEVATIKHLDWELLISAPEQAFMECLLLAPKRYDYMDLFYIMEQLTTLRPKVVQNLIETTQNYRIKRVFLYMAEKAGHYWFEDLDLSKVDIGTHKLQLVKSGVYISKYLITVPKELNSYE